jgi:hypothetical protein
VLGVTAPEKPQVSVTKADVPFERIREIAKTIAEGVAKAASENPDLYRQYREATGTRRWRRSSRPRVLAQKRSLDHSRVTDSSSSVVI